ncbi:MAG: hypothetical protein ABEJ28_01085 [Salinigranum sp.]
MTRRNESDPRPGRSTTSGAGRSTTGVGARIARGLSRNWWTELRDAVVVLAWVTVLAAGVAVLESVEVGGFHPFGTWFYYAALAFGIASYSLFTRPWDPPE